MSKTQSTAAGVAAAVVAGIPSPTATGDESLGASVRAVQELLAAKKRVVRAMSWTPRLSSRGGPAWFRYRTPLEDEHGVTLEGVFVDVQWRVPMLERPSKLGIGLFLEESRVYAIDIDPLGKHKNIKGGKGRPLYGQSIDGPHEHTWSQDGYGYVDPLTVPEIEDVAVAWFEFLKRARIDDPFPFVHPDPALSPGISGRLDL